MPTVTDIGKFGFLVVSEDTNVEGRRINQNDLDAALDKVRAKFRTGIIKLDRGGVDYFVTLPDTPTSRFVAVFLVTGPAYQDLTEYAGFVAKAYNLTAVRLYVQGVAVEVKPDYEA